MLVTEAFGGMRSEGQGGFAAILLTALLATAALLLLAVGSAGAATITVTTTDDELDPTAINGDGISLREAIRDAASGDTIDFDAALDGATIVLGTNPGTGTNGSGHRLFD